MNLSKETLERISKAKPGEIIVVDDAELEQLTANLVGKNEPGAEVLGEGDRVCSTCYGAFNLETEGGVAGDIGILPVAFCPTCRAGIIDFVQSHACCRDVGCMYDEESLKDMRQALEVIKGIIKDLEAAV